MICVFAVSCGQFGDGKPHHKPVSAAPVDKTVVQPDIFEVAPNKIAGCSGLYMYDSLMTSYDNLDVDKGKKILAVKTESLAYLKIKGKDVFLTYDKASSGLMSDGNKKEVYKGAGITAVLVIQEIGAEGETVRQGGTLEISKGKAKVKIKIKGLSGC